jgi:hypothetical protein
MKRIHTFKTIGGQTVNANIYEYARECKAEASKLWSYRHPLAFISLMIAGLVTVGILNTILIFAF